MAPTALKLSLAAPLTRRRWLAATTLTLAAGAARADRPLLRAGDQKGGLHALLDAAGELDGLSYDIKWVEIPAAAPLAEALNGDAVDVGPIGDAPLLFALANGVPIKAIGVNRSDPYGTAVLVRRDSPLKTAADLKGRHVATNRGSIGQLVALRALASAGLRPEPDTFRFLPPAESLLALTQGAVDAWATWEPYTAMAEVAGHARVLVNGRGLWSGLSYLAATDRAIATQRPVLADFLQRIVRAQLWSDRHVPEFSAALARIIGIAPEAARLQFERRRQRWIPFDTQVAIDQQSTADFFLANGLLKQHLSVATTFDTRFSLGA